MSVVAISGRTHPPGGPSRSAGGRRRTGTAGPSVLTITLDLSLTGEALAPRASRVLELLRDLVELGDGTVTVTEDGDFPAALQTLPPAGSPPAPAAAPVEAVDPGALRILAGSRLVRLDGEIVPLTRLEFDLLLFLAEHPRQVFTRLQLLGNVWGYEHAIARTVDVHVRRLRAKVGESVPLVTTVYGVGYRLADDARVTVDRTG